VNQTKQCLKKHEIYAAIRDAPIRWGDVSECWRKDPFGEFERAADENVKPLAGKNKHVKTTPSLTNLEE